MEMYMPLVAERKAWRTEHSSLASSQQVTTKKRETLILNVDGCIAACFVDLLRSCGAFTQEEVRVDTGLLSTRLTSAGLPDGKVALARSMILYRSTYMARPPVICCDVLSFDATLVHASVGVSLVFVLRRTS